MTEFSLKALVEPFNSPELRSSASGWQGQILNLELVDETGLCILYSRFDLNMLL